MTMCEHKLPSARTSVARRSSTQRAGPHVCPRLRRMSTSPRPPRKVGPWRELGDAAKRRRRHIPPRRPPRRPKFWVRMTMASRPSTLGMGEMTIPRFYSRPGRCGEREQRIRYGSGAESAWLRDAGPLRWGVQIRGRRATLRPCLFWRRLPSFQPFRLLFVVW